MAGTINTTLNDIWKSTMVGDVRSAIGAALYGINHRQTPGAVPINRDGNGLTFFTRPQLNLTDDNASVLRTMVPLLTTEPESIQRMVRKLLDPRQQDLPCSLVDDKLAFIPILTNHLLSCSGWPDPSLDVHTSKPGVYKEEFSLYDSVTDKYSSWNLSTTFRNMVGDPIGLILQTWLDYGSAVFRGDMTPYADFIASNTYDYNTRIYRLVLDRNRRLVQKIACTGASIPLNNPQGNSFNFEHDRPINQGNDQIQVNWRCIGYQYNDHILVREFNAAVGIFNPAMRDANYYLDMVQVPEAALLLFNNMGYPRIDPDSLELQWWVSQDQYEAIMGGFTRTAQATGLTLDPRQYTPPSTIQPD